MVPLTSGEDRRADRNILVEKDAPLFVLAHLAAGSLGSPCHYRVPLRVLPLLVDVRRGDGSSSDNPNTAMQLGVVLVHRGDDGIAGSQEAAGEGNTEVLNLKLTSQPRSSACSVSSCVMCRFVYRFFLWTCHGTYAIAVFGYVMIMLDAMFDSELLSVRRRCTTFLVQ